MVKKADLTGQRFSNLVAVKADGVDTTGKTKWLCLCDCGNQKSITLLNLRSGNSKSCGCKKHLTGKENPRTIVDTSILKNKKRSFAMRRHWRKSVLDRDICCKKCSTDKNLQAHHILGVQEYPEQMLEVSNGITLCFRCHLDFHLRYGRKKGFTREDLDEFLTTQ